MSRLVPFGRISQPMLSDFDQIFKNLDGFFFRPAQGTGAFKLDVEETPSAFNIQADLPGVQKEEIELKLNEDGVLVIAVRKEEQAEEEGKNYIHRERRCSSAARSVYLQDADPQGIKARLTDGVLAVTVNKRDKKDGTVQISIE